FAREALRVQLRAHSREQFLIDLDAFRHGQFVLAIRRHLVGGIVALVRRLVFVVFSLEARVFLSRLVRIGDVLFPLAFVAGSRLILFAAVIFGIENAFGRIFFATLPAGSGI